MQRTNIHLPESIRERLRALAERLGYRPAELVRQALEDFLKRHKA